MLEFSEIKKQLLSTFSDRGLKIACAESCTGGMISSALTDLPGSSKIFDRGFITYSNAAKIDLLGVSEETLLTHGAVSEEVAREMALGGLARSDAQVVISVTGISGPGTSESKPEGLVCFALAQAENNCLTKSVEFGAIGRSKVRLESCKFALKFLFNLGKQPIGL